MSKVVVYVVAGPNQGKTTIASIIQEALKSYGFIDVKLLDIRASKGDKAPIDQRVEAAKLRPIEIQVAIAPLALCEQCKEYTVAYAGAQFCGAGCSQLKEMGE
jgi:NADH pyrophosphatase NudC (nudix superfamily)